MRVLIATTHVPFVYGGAESHAAALKEALQAVGHEADIAAIPFKWYPPDRIPDHMLAARLLDITSSSGQAIDRVIGLKFPAYLVRHPNKIIWVLHQFRGAYDLWERADSDLLNAPSGAHLREAIRAADATAFAESQAIYANSRNVADRLKKFCGVDASPLYHPPPRAEEFTTSAYEDFLLVPSRIEKLKRQDLIVDALRLTEAPVRAVFIGPAPSSQVGHAFRDKLESADIGDRFTWLGDVSEAEKLDLYARCLGVVFTPLDEDYGYVTLEAMLAAKPVITCTDSGGPLEFVIDRQTGLVCAPRAKSLAQAMDELWQDRKLSREYGAAGRDHYSSFDLSWSRVLSCLLG